MELIELGQVEQKISNSKGIEKRLLPLYEFKLEGEVSNEEFRINGIICSQVLDRLPNSLSLGIKYSNNVQFKDAFFIEQYCGFETAFMEINSEDLCDLPKISDKLGIPIRNSKKDLTPYGIVGFVRF